MRSVLSIVRWMGCWTVRPALPAQPGVRRPIVRLVGIAGDLFRAAAELEVQADEAAQPGLQLRVGDDAGADAHHRARLLLERLVEGGDRAAEERNRHGAAVRAGVDVGVVARFQLDIAGNAARLLARKVGRLGEPLLELGQLGAHLRRHRHAGEALQLQPRLVGLPRREQGAHQLGARRREIGIDGERALEDDDRESRFAAVERRDAVEVHPLGVGQLVGGRIEQLEGLLRLALAQQVLRAIRKTLRQGRGRESSTQQQARGIARAPPCNGLHGFPPRAAILMDNGYTDRCVAQTRVQCAAP
jgi:hypothetical protein